MKNAARQPLLAATAAAAVIATGLIGPASPALAASPTSEQSTTQGFRKAVTVPGIQEHLRAFQSHSDTGGGNRVAGSVGFEKSVEYVAAQARAAGFQVSFDDFTFLYNADATPPTLVQTAPTATTYVDGNDYSSMTFSESRVAATRAVHAVDLVLPAAGLPQPSNTSGCEVSDFAGFPAGAIALLQRGTCTFGTKSGNAKAAGAYGAVIMNEGNNAGRSGVLGGTLGAANLGAALGTTTAVGVDLANGIRNGDTGSVVTYRIDRVQETRTTRNVIAETPTGDPNQVVVVGAHLDSVPRGAGINDNGSGSAGILEIAEQLAVRGFDNRNKVRFIWWSAEEFGLLGSRAYVAKLPQAERDKIALNLNFDMIGSPNYARFVYDGDNSAFPVGPGAADGPTGSGEIERVFTDYFKAAGLASGETPFSGRSDYGPFIAAGVDIPAGGLFTGAESLKTAAEVGFFGGTAGVAYDACYHLACDTIANVNLKGLDEMSDAAAHATLHFAKRNFVKQPLVDPTTPVTGIATTPSGGGLHEDDHEGDVS